MLDDMTETTHLLQVPIHIPRQLSEKHPEEIREKRARKVQSLLSEVITIVQLSPLHGSK